MSKLGSLLARTRAALDSVPSWKRRCRRPLRKLLPSAVTQEEFDPFNQQYSLESLSQCLTYGYVFPKNWCMATSENIGRFGDMRIWDEELIHLLFA